MSLASIGLEKVICPGEIGLLRKIALLPGIFCLCALALLPALLPALESGG